MAPDRTVTAAAWLKQKRTAAGYPKQANLAAALGRSRTMVANWESPTGPGKPSAAIVPRLAELLGVSQREIIERFGIRMEGDISPATAPPEWAREVIERLEVLTGLVQQQVGQQLSSAPEVSEGATPKKGGGFSRARSKAVAALREEAAREGRRLPFPVHMPEFDAPAAADQPKQATVSARAPSPSPWPLLIRLGRTAQGMSPGQLAVRTGTNTRTVEGWEAGRSEPSLRQRTRLVALFAGSEAPAERSDRRQATG